MAFPFASRFPLIRLQALHTSRYPLQSLTQLSFSNHSPITQSTIHHLTNCLSLRAMTEAEEEVAPKTTKQKVINFLKLLAKIVVTSALLYYVFSKVPLSKVKDHFLVANYWWMFAAFLCFILSTVVSSWRLLSFIKSIGLKLDWRFNLRLYLLGMFYNFLLPGGIGGDGYKIYLLKKKYNIPAKKTFWALLFDRLSGLWAIGLIVCILIVLVPQFPLHFFIPGSIFLAGTAIYYGVARYFFKDYTHYFFTAHLKAVMVQSLQLLTILLVMFGQNFTGKFAAYLLSFLLSALAAVLPTIGGAGAREAIFTKLADVFHMQVGLAVYLSISFYLISLLVAISGVYYLLRPSRLEEGLPKVEEGSVPIEDEGDIL
ncbi:lysylphosphatidylglycerol synthase transmembrane domain-containing protein [Mucilaginibacter ginkgonis]|uniref:Flippase-like domain-containing protein n=1 Tax=Mucilaginibacter ginkgonis TaxID=2682091 RepID=A0A6I4HVF8_9SPHI|nr:lysylphosphatidylglycerol synthase transmembrane domain-containing protein [Mucilaginibacter ginkgonis]QQL49858.1 flippase-like domain-containing protein [Mucilaginibacter ginkgonis]